MWLRRREGKNVNSFESTVVVAVAAVLTLCLLQVTLVVPWLVSAESTTTKSDAAFCDEQCRARNVTLGIVRDAFTHAYDSYMRHAFPRDELCPLSCTGKDTWGPFALTLVDTLDTLYIMGNFSEFEAASRRLLRVLNFDIDRNVSVFETNIRVLGGLLSAHHCALTIRRESLGQHMSWYAGEFLELSADVGARLLPAFNTSTGIPYGTVNLRHGVPFKETPITSLAGGGTHILEFIQLTRLTGNPAFEAAGRRALRALWALRSSRHLWGNHINTRTGTWTHLDSGIGPNQDSFYEYLLKAYVMTGDAEYLAMFDTAYRAIVANMKKGDWYVDVNMRSGVPTLPWFTSLSAFWPGLQVLYGHTAAAERTLRHFHTLWRKFGFVPEVYDLNRDRVHPQQTGYFLRPEMVESMMYLYRVRRDPLWLRSAQDVLASLDTVTRTTCGYAVVTNVTDHTLGDRMESFFLSETLKYLYLLASNDGPQRFLDTVVFNTEAHPLPILGQQGVQSRPAILPWDTEGRAGPPLCPRPTFVQRFGGYGAALPEAESVTRNAIPPPIRKPGKRRTRRDQQRALQGTQGGQSATAGSPPQATLQELHAALKEEGLQKALQEADTPEGRNAVLERITQIMSGFDVDPGSLVKEQQPLPSPAPAPASATTQRSPNREESTPTQHEDVCTPERAHWRTRRTLLWDECITYNAGYWTYDFCFGRSATQYHVDDNKRRTEEHVLGVRNIGALVSAAQTLTDVDRAVRRHADGDDPPSEDVVDDLDGGDVCGAMGQPRTARVRYTCKDGPALRTAQVTVEETTPCRYEAIVETPLMCSSTR